MVVSIWKAVHGIETSLQEKFGMQRENGESTEVKP